MADASFLKTFMATSVVNLPMYEVEPLLIIGQVLNIGSSEIYCCWVFFCLFVVVLFSHYWGYVIFSYVTETKTSQE